VFLEVQIQKEKQSPVEYELKVTVPAEVMTEKMAAAMDEIMKSVTMPGFRPGHVPRKVVEQRFGQKLAAEVADEVLQEAYKDALSQAEIEPVSPGEMKNVEFKKGEPLTFAVTVEVMPEFELPPLSEVSVELPMPEVGEEDVLAALDGLRESHSTLIPTDEASTRDCVITADLQELDPSGLPIIGRVQKDVDLDLSRVQLGEDFAAKVIGLRAGEGAVVELPMRAEEDKPKTARFQVTVNAVKRKEMPALDADFARLINPQFNSVEDLKADLSRYLEARAHHQAHERMLRSVADSLLRMVDFPVPPRMLEVYLDRMAEDATHHMKKRPDPKILEHFKEEQRASAIWNLRWHLVRKKVIADRKIEVSEDDYKSEVERLAQIDGKSAAEFEKRLSEEQADRVREDLLERKVLAVIESEIQSVPRPVALAEFEGRTPSKIITP
jgi:trigger factor